MSVLSCDPWIGWASSEGCVQMQAVLHSTPCLVLVWFTVLLICASETSGPAQHDGADTYPCAERVSVVIIGSKNTLTGQGCMSASYTVSFATRLCKLTAQGSHRASHSCRRLAWSRTSIRSLLWTSCCNHSAPWYASTTVANRSDRAPDEPRVSIVWMGEFSGAHAIDVQT
jgi:hypothetical protein